MAGTRSQSGKLALAVPFALRGQPTLVMQRLGLAWRGVPIFSLLMLTGAILCALFAPLLAPYDPIRTNPVQALAAPSLSQHLLGTDHLGRAAALLDYAGHPVAGSTTCAAPAPQDSARTPDTTPW